MTKKITLETFINNAQKLHKDKYDYSQSIYNGYNKEITINCPTHGNFIITPHKHIKGIGCILCNDKDDRTENFINECKIIHNNKYDYSKVIYKASREKIIIICPNHSEFQQTASNHKKGQGCPICRSSCNKIDYDKKIKPGLERFIHKSQLIHGDKYDYSKVNYKSCKENIEIICPEHGNFITSPDSHINQKTGCKECKLPKITTENFIEELKIIHNNKYDYSKTIYTKSKNLIIIICPDHGEFKKTANAHKKGDGCSKCYGNYSFTNEEFIKRVSLVHNNKYDYSKTNYSGSRNEIIIICPKHGEYTQIADCHTMGQNCPKCARNFYSKGQIQWLELIEKLENISIQHIGNSSKEFKIPTTNYKVDGYCKETNIVFEYYGSYFHADPKVYKSDFYNKTIKKTMGEIYQKTIARENIIKELGYEVRVMWENDWKNINKSIIKIQRKFRLKQCQLNINKLSIS